MLSRVSTWSVVRHETHSVMTDMLTGARHAQRTLHCTVNTKRHLVSGEGHNQYTSTMAVHAQVLSLQLHISLIYGPVQDPYPYALRWLNRTI